MNPTLSILFGHAMADALGVPVEFQTREQLQANPVTSGVDYHDVIERFCNWMNNQQYTATGVFSTSALQLELPSKTLWQGKNL